MSVAIVTDTVACLLDDLASQHDIKVIPLQVVHEGKTYLDRIDITPARFYHLLATSPEMPTTSAPPPETYVEAFQELLAQDKEILVICPSRKLTHVYESAGIAAGLIQETQPAASIAVLDSGTAASAQGFVALDAAVAAQQGDSLPEVIRTAENTMKKVHVVVFLDTLDYLVKGGRVPHILGWANALLKIKPMIELKPLGKGVVPVDRVRTRPRALERLVRIIREKAGGRPIRIVVQHTNCPEEAVGLEGMLKAALNCINIHIQDFTPVMGLHTGPGLLGVSYCL
jgi:DegV family protein with EDD domain